MSRRRLAIYHPNLHFFGGGEIVALETAVALKDHFEVTLLHLSKVKRQALETFCGLSLDGIHLENCSAHLPPLDVSSPRESSRALKLLYPRFSGFSHVVDTCTNGWFDKRLAIRTLAYIHCPVFYGAVFPKDEPVTLPDGLTSYPRLCFTQDLSPDKRPECKAETSFQYDLLLCNSEFTKQHLTRFTARIPEVLYPPVRLPTGHVQNWDRRSPRIVAVGRFTPDKQFEVLIEAFRRLHELSDIPWELHLVGTFRPVFYDGCFLQRLRAQARDLSIYFRMNLSRDEVLRLLSQSAIYWHARGYSYRHPEAFESFGISTVEAQACGCIPFVFPAGGQKEVVRDGVTGFYWTSIKELATSTVEVMRKRRVEISKAAQLSAHSYSSEYFRAGILRHVLTLARNNDRTCL